MSAVSMVDPLVDLTKKSIGETGAQVLAKDRPGYSSTPSSADIEHLPR
jgi:hypothetical protein